MSTTRKIIPIIFFGAVTAYTTAYGLYDAGLCVRDIIARRLAAWNDFIGAELFLLVAWRFWLLTRASLAIRRGTVKSEQVRIKGGVTGRILFLVATLVVTFACILTKFLLDFYSVAVPWWFTHLGHSVVAVLIFCTFTFPWRRRHRMTPNTALEPTPTAP